MRRMGGPIGRRPMSRSTDLQELAERFEGLVERKDTAEGAKAEALLEQFTRLTSRSYRTSLKAFDTFLPPRLVRSACESRAVVFFGAGVSAEAGIPMWWDLLETLGISSELAEDPELAHDPLTAAEVLAHQIGIPNLDDSLRQGILKQNIPATAHFLLAALNQDVYITTNYDCLFETAWEKTYGVAPRVITTDADLGALNAKDPFARDNKGAPLVFKLHGSAAIDEEELILTRSQYRRHYRTNQELFDHMRKLLGRAHTLFLGFGHRDPEITRLVEDVIHAFEITRPSKRPQPQPAFYSLQYNMGPGAPEIFAARGIVALDPPRSLTPPSSLDPRTFALTRSLIDLLGAVDSSAHRALELDASLSKALEKLAEDVGSGLNTLDGVAKDQGKRGAVSKAKLASCAKKLGALASQGIYVLNASGETVNHWLPDGLSLPDRSDRDFRGRPYVRQARMYRLPFASTTAESVFNGNATTFLCVPVLAHGKYDGLVFSAFQVGTWETPIELQKQLQEDHKDIELSVLLIDSNGVLLLPPNREFSPRRARVRQEPPAANIGFEFKRLYRLSRRDKLVERIWNNIVPLAQDDDVTNLGDVKMYSVVSDVPQTRWKLALSIPS
jgi:SIR2-like domain